MMKVQNAVCSCVYYYLHGFCFVFMCLSLCVCVRVFVCVCVVCAFVASCGVFSVLCSCSSAFCILSTANSLLEYALQIICTRQRHSNVCSQNDTTTNCRSSFLPCFFASNSTQLSACECICVCVCVILRSAFA